MRLSENRLPVSGIKTPALLADQKLFGGEGTFRYLIGMSRLISRSLAVGLCAFLGACATAPKVTKNTSKTYYHSGDSFDLANRIQSKLVTIPHSANRGVHTANFRVLRLATYPAVLVECGFLSNRSEGSEARSIEYRELLADRIAEAIVEQRYGPGVYHASAEATVQPEPPSEGPGLA